MQTHLSTHIMRHSFIVAVLLHLLLLCLLITHITFWPVTKPEKPPQYYVPSYVYKGAITPAKSERQTQTVRVATPQTSFVEKMKPQPPINQKKIFTQSQSMPHRSMLAASFAALQQNSIAAAMNQPQDEEPILLVGDNTRLADPLIKLLGRSLSAHFSYPKMEGSFGLRGRVLVSLVLHPEGFYSNVQIVQSSENRDFDNAALYAVNSAPKIIGADHFLEKPKRFIVGFIFD